MPRLSIVIPCVQGAVYFESTLASVLQNRPADCEVLIVQPCGYDDPYALGGEVTFLQAPSNSSVVDLINFGIQAASGAVVHVLTCDMAVLDGWTEPALTHFDDPMVGSVSPLIMSAQGDMVVSRGVRYGAGGRRQVRVKARARWQSQERYIVGPTLSAGFYARQALLDVGLFCHDVGDEFADVDLALALRSVGLCAVHEALSAVVSLAPASSSGLSFRRGQQAERLFWRNGALSGWPRALAAHLGTLAGEVLFNLHRRAMVSQLLGRVAASGQIAAYRRHRRRLESVRAARQSPESRILPFRRPQGSGCSERLHPRTAA
ncbi:MAG: glycosyltransferase family 2 protein [Pirellulaceae bacterium]